MEVGELYNAIGGFYALMGNDVMEQLRCEASIKSVHYICVETVTNS